MIVYLENHITLNQEAYDDSQSQQAADSQSQQAADRNEAFSGTENDAAPTSPPPVLKRWLSLIRMNRIGSSKIASGSGFAPAETDKGLLKI